MPGARNADEMCLEPIIVLVLVYLLLVTTFIVVAPVLYPYLYL